MDKVRQTTGGVYPGGVSIILCSFNREPLLRRMVESIVEQLPTAYPIEIIIADNNSTDGTAAFGKAMAAKRPEIVYLLETEQGLSHARNAGAAAAKFEFLLYLDDDAVLCPDYLRMLGERLTEHDPDFFGGPIYPLYADPKPVWFPESLEVRKKTAASGFYNNVSLTGANYGVRASVLKRVGGFNPRYGMTGVKTGMLEERLVIENYRRITPADEQKVYYSLENYVMHHTPARRMTVKFQLERIYLADYQYVQYCLEHGVRTPRLLLRELWRRFWGAFTTTLKSAPRIWRNRAQEPEIPLLRAVKITQRWANVRGVVNFMLTDFGRVGRRRHAHVVERPLEILFVQGPVEGRGPKEKSDQVAAREAAIEAMSAFNTVRVVNIEKATNDQMRALMANVNFRATDVILLDSSKILSALSVHRADWPHLQFLLWSRERFVLAFLADKGLMRQPMDMFRRVMRERARYGKADQVITSHLPANRRALRFLIPMRNEVVLPGIQPLKARVETWRRALREALVWAPDRRSV